MFVDPFFKCTTGMLVWCSPDCSCTLRPASCHQATKRCSVPNVCVLQLGRRRLNGLLKLYLDTSKMMLLYRGEFIPLAVWCGVSVIKSQKRTVVSPEPLARYLQQTQRVCLQSQFHPLYLVFYHGD